MKELWVDAGENLEMVRAAIDNNAEAILVKKEIFGDVKKVGKIKVIGENFGDLRIGKDVEMIEIATKEDEGKVIELSRKFEYLIVFCRNWKVIPLENLLAQSSTKIIARVKSPTEAEVSLKILEKGVAGVLLATENPMEIRATREIIEKKILEKIDLVGAEITQILTTESGDRACVDTTTLMEEGEGLLVGNYSDGFFLVQAECEENPFVKPRPFRVNAGAIHAYVRIPEGKTAYLSELESKAKVLIVNTEGKGKTVSVGRTKTERRPLVFVEAIFQGRRASIFLQNAETIRLIRENGKSISISELKVGDKVLCHFSEIKGRHIGATIEETIIEK